jgi:uncharacterized protein YndB with AHSA1/START domain
MERCTKEGEIMLKKQLNKKRSDLGLTMTVTVDRSPKEVFDAINSVRAWWSEDIHGSTDKLGATFTYRYKDMHRSNQTITELVPSKKVVWHVSDSQLNFVRDKGEWDGTDIVFEIARKGDRTELRFTHVGLVPALECYGACEQGWGYYIKNSLRSLIKTGEGRPDRKEEEAGKKAA